MIWDSPEGGCEHQWGEAPLPATKNAQNGSTETVKYASLVAEGKPTAGAMCLRCRAWRGSLGLEPTPQLYVQHLVAVMREVRRVLREDGVCFLNMGDSYASSWGSNRRNVIGNPSRTERAIKMGDGLKEKDLVGIPWRVALALQEDGWTLRSDVIWSKLNPMPESVQDRPTRSHEYIFILSKAKWVGEPAALSYISDQDARWLALFLDTEGNIVAKRATVGEKTQYGAQIAFANTSRPLLETARRIIGYGTILQRPGRNAPMFYYQASGRQAEALLRRLYPFLIVKQRQAKLGVHLQELLRSSEAERRSKVGRLRGRQRSDDYTATLERIWATMKNLNHFGTPDLSWVPELNFGHWDSLPYYWDQEAVREPAEYGYRHHSTKWVSGQENGDGHRSGGGSVTGGNPETGRNIRSVWTIPTQPYSGAHFATFPEALVERCILAGTSERGCCPECGAPWERVVLAAKGGSIGSSWHDHKDDKGMGQGQKHTGEATYKTYEPPQTVGWHPTCAHADLAPVPCLTLDPFSGAGTVALVAQKLGRRAIGIDMSLQYTALAIKRLEAVPLPMGGV